jgi:hypothetical protein
MGPANCLAGVDATRRRAEIAHAKPIVRTHSNCLETSIRRSCRLHVPLQQLNNNLAEAHTCLLLVHTLLHALQPTLHNNRLRQRL